MGAGLQRAFAATAISRLTDRQRQVYDALTHDWLSALEIADKAQIKTYSGRETAAKFAIQLTKLGLAEKGGTRSQPVWRRKTPA